MSLLSFILAASTVASQTGAVLAESPSAPASAGQAGVVESPAPALTSTDPTVDDRLRAATSSGVIAFVGLTIGGIAIPGLLGLVANGVGVALSTEVLYTAAVVGGSLGAASGGFIGAIPTVRWYGIPVVAAGAAVGSLVGLIPVALVSSAAAADPPNGLDTFHPLNLAQSGALVLAMAGAASGGAVAGAIFADRWEPEQQ